MQVDRVARALEARGENDQATAPVLHLAGEAAFRGRARAFRIGYRNPASCRQRGQPIEKRAGLRGNLAEEKQRLRLAGHSEARSEQSCARMSIEAVSLADKDSIDSDLSNRNAFSSHVDPARNAHLGTRSCRRMPGIKTRHFPHVF